VLAIPARVIATSFAIICFVGTLSYGWYNGNELHSILISAIGVCFFAWLVGTVVGMIALRTVNDHIEKHRMQNPVPDENSEIDTDPMRTAVG